MFGCLESSTSVWRQQPQMLHALLNALASVFCNGVETTLQMGTMLGVTVFRVGASLQGQ